MMAGAVDTRDKKVAVSASAPSTQTLYTQHHASSMKCHGQCRGLGSQQLNAAAQSATVLTGLSQRTLQRRECAVTPAPHAAHEASLSSCMFGDAFALVALQLQDVRVNTTRPTHMHRPRPAPFLACSALWHAKQTYFVLPASYLCSQGERMRACV
jgi:hypothetical protein